MTAQATIDEGRLQTLKLPHTYQRVTDRFVAACQADERVVAATLYGSYARGAADAYSDLDLSLITTDAGYEDVVAGRESFMRRLGEPLFLEDFDLPNYVFFVFADGVEGELLLGRQGDFNHAHGGPYLVLVDKQNILSGAVFPRNHPTQAEQIETLRRLVCWFWHDLSHLITALGRGQLWWAYGQLEELRRSCVNLARLRQTFSIAADGYEKVEEALPVERLAVLEATCCPLEHGRLLQAAYVVAGVYQGLARPLAQTHGIPYPDRLERMLLDRLEQLGSRP